MIELAPHRFPGVTYAMVARELAREGAARINVYKRQIDKGAMTEAEARRQLALFEALEEDCTRFRDAAAPAALAPAKHRFSWRERRDALLRELAFRARLYPGWIEKQKLTQADADQRNACLEALLCRFEDGWDWQPANGHMPRFALPAAEVTPDQLASRREWHAIAAEVYQRQHGEPYPWHLLPKAERCVAEKQEELAI